MMIESQLQLAVCTIQGRILQRRQLCKDRHAGLQPDHPHIHEPQECLRRSVDFHDQDSVAELHKIKACPHSGTDAINAHSKAQYIIEKAPTLSTANAWMSSAALDTAVGKVGLRQVLLLIRVRHCHGLPCQRPHLGGNRPETTGTHGTSEILKSERPQIVTCFPQGRLLATEVQVRPLRRHLL
jgi:hypothetical protein